MGETPYQGYRDLLVEKRPDGVVVATLNRPERLNAFGGQLRPNIRRVVQEVRDDPEARVLLFTGAGRGFCSGADLTPGEEHADWPTAPWEPRFAWSAELLGLLKPTIAAINGPAAGGGLGLALLCDIRIASDRARLIPLWLRRAIQPDDIATWTLPHLIGYSRALKYLFLADEIPLEEAERVGLVDKVVSHERLMEEALALASRLAQGPPLHMALAKQAVLRGLHREPWDAALMESWAGTRAASFADSEEGRAAFRERRDPVFRGR